MAPMGAGGPTGNPGASETPAGAGPGGGGHAALPLTGDGSAGTPFALNPATDGTPGSLSAADKSKLDSFASPGWADAQAALIQSLGLGLTAFDYQKLNVSPNGLTTLGANITDANIEGGGLANNTSWAVYSGAIFQDLAGKQFALAWYGALPAIVAGNAGYIGLTNAGHTHTVTFNTDQAASATKFNGTINGPASTPGVTSLAADANLHSFMITKPAGASSVTFWVDGVPVLVQATIANLTTEPMFFGAFASAGRSSIVGEYLYAWKR